MRVKRKKVVVDRELKTAATKTVGHNDGFVLFRVHDHQTVNKIRGKYWIMHTRPTPHISSISESVWLW